MFFFFYSFFLLAQDWVITDNQILEDTTIVLDGNLIVKAGGSLTFKTVTLIMNCQFEGQYRIEVKPEGSLFIYQNSNITANILDNRFAFAVHGSSFEMKNSELHGAGWGDEDELNNDYGLVMSGSKGLIITTNNAILDSNTYSNNHVGVIIADSGAVISNNQFYNNHAQSLYVRDAIFVTITDNYILNETGSAALHITSDNNNRYINNEIISNHGHGIVTGNSHYSIIENNIIHAELISIFMLGSCTNNLIKGNDILSNEVGMQIWGWSNVIRDKLSPVTGVGWERVYI